MSMSLSARRLVVGSAAVLLAALLGVAFFVPSLAQPLGSNIIQLLSTASGVAPQLKAAGQDANISINAVPKGTGCFQVNGVCVTPGGAGPPLAGTFLTWTDQSATIPNSRNLIAGTNVTFDDTVANARTVNVPVTPGGVGIHGPCVATDIAVWFDGSNITCFADFRWIEADTALDIGGNTLTGASTAFAIGSGNTTDGLFVYIMGSSNDLTGAIDAGAWGESHTVSSFDSYAFGEGCDLSAANAICVNASVGAPSVITGSSSGSFGLNNTISVSDGWAFGEQNLVDTAISGSLGTVGLLNTVSGGDSWAFGENITITHNDAVLLGNNLTSQADNSVSIGISSTPEITITTVAGSVQIAMPGIKASGAAGGKRVVCIDNTTKILYTSSTGTDCSN